MDTLGNIRKQAKNKGFTLVELIVVLVILAIMAAILVPALLGYVDRAKGEQIVLDARSVYTATQAELTSLYAKGVPSSQITSKDTWVRICNTADVYDASDSLKSTVTVQIGVGGENGHAAYTVKELIFCEGSGSDARYIYFDGKSWEECDNSKALNAAGKANLTNGAKSLNPADAH